MVGGFKGGESKLSSGRSTPLARIHDGTSAKIESLKYVLPVWKEEKDRAYAKDSRLVWWLGAPGPQASAPGGCVLTSRRQPPSLVVSVFGFNVIFIPAPAGVDRKGSETQVAQTCVIALRLWQKFPLAK